MKDEITINLRALTENQRDTIKRVLDFQLNCFEDETNAEALEVLQNFQED